MRILHLRTALFAFPFFVFFEPALLQAQPFDSSSVAATEIRFQQLEKEIRRLTGHVEEQDYEIRRLREELAKVTGDLEVRVRDVEQGVSRSGSSFSSPSFDSGSLAVPDSDLPSQNVVQSQQSSSSFQYQPPGDGQALGTINASAGDSGVSSSDPAVRAYEDAYSFIKDRDFNRAEQAFAGFIESHPDHSLISNAKYWYGETFYVRGNNEKAARIFAEGYQKFPKGPKAADNLLKLGMALTGMGKKDEACIAYKQLKKDYARSSAPVLKRADTEMKRIDCR